MSIEAEQSPEWERDALAGGIKREDLAAYSWLQARIYRAVERVRFSPDSDERAHGTINELRLWKEGRGLAGIYAICHVAKGREYIGQSRDIHKRLMSHFSALASGLHSTPRLLEDYIQDGIYAFEWRLLKQYPVGSSSQFLLEIEAEWIRRRKPYYNSQTYYGMPTR